MKQTVPLFTGMPLVAALVALVAALGVGPADGSSPEVIDRIVAEVNDDVITLYELNQASRPFLQSAGGANGDLRTEGVHYEIREQVLNKLIDQKLTDQEIQRLDISVSEETVDRTIEEIKQRNRMTDADLERQIRNEGMTQEEFRKQVRDQILRGRLVNREVKSKIVITEEDIEACYTGNAEVYCAEKRYHIRHIMASVPPYGDADAKQEARQRMEAVLDLLGKGASFEELARTRSDSPMKDKGGEIGAFELKDLALPIRQAVEKTEPGRFTPIVETDQGFQIFFVDRITEENSKNLDEVRGEIEAQLYNEVVNQKFADWLSELRKKSHIKIIR